MGQITNPISKGITVLPTDRESGPGAGGGASGNNSLFLGAGAGQNSTAANLIILGNAAGDNGIASVSLNGTVIVGVNAGSGLTSPAAVVGANILIGPSVLALSNYADSNVMIGQNIMENSAPVAAGDGTTQNVMIGRNILLNVTTTNGGSQQSSVLIGDSIAQNFTGYAFTQQSVVIGANALQGVMTSGSEVNQSVLIGYGVAPSYTGAAAQDVVIGASSDVSAGGSYNIIVGAGSSSTYAATDGHNVLIGGQAHTYGSLNVAIGYAAATSAAGSNIGNVVIGANAGATLPATTSNMFVLESSTTVGGGTGNAASALAFGSFLSGNIVLGKSLQGTNRDLIVGGTATNILKLINGTIGGANPVGGGYFYVTAGVLNWVDSAGTNTQLSMTTAGQLAGNALTAYTNNAAAAAGTLLNAPVAGNPTKWIPINDNGTIRNIPAW